MTSKPTTANCDSATPRRWPPGGRRQRRAGTAGCCAYFARSGLLNADDASGRRASDNSGFSLDASARIGAHDRAGLERLLRYCARPPLTLQRLEQLDAQRVNLSLAQTPARWPHGAVSYPAGADRPAGALVAIPAAGSPGGAQVPARAALDPEVRRTPIAPRESKFLPAACACANALA